MNNSLESGNHFNQLNSLEREWQQRKQAQQAQEKALFSCNLAVTAVVFVLMQYPWDLYAMQQLNSRVTATATAGTFSSSASSMYYNSDYFEQSLTGNQFSLGIYTWRLFEYVL